jgi:hypothetical protein
MQAMCAGCIEDEGLKAYGSVARTIELSLGDADVERIAQSQTEPGRAGAMLAYREDPSFFAVDHQTVQRALKGQWSNPNGCAG